jgi:hypothetical protein
VNASGVRATAVLATSAPDGSFSFAVPNGTYVITTVLPSFESASYAPDVFTLVVNHAGGRTPVPLLPDQWPVHVLVLSGLSDLPITAAVLSFSGIVQPESLPVVANGNTSVLGTSTVLLFTGVYNLTVSAPGFVTSRTTVAPGIQGNTSITVKLAAVVQAAPSNTQPLSPAAGLAISGGAIVLAAGAFLATRRLRAAPVTPSGAPGAV